MALFRALLNLDKGGKTIYAGSFTRLEWQTPQQQQVMIDVGAVAEVSAPPLEALPGWSTRAVKLAPLGIVDVVQFLEADPDEIARTLRRKTEVIAGYRQELYRWLTADAPAAG